MAAATTMFLDCPLKTFRFTIFFIVGGKILSPSRCSGNQRYTCNASLPRSDPDLGSHMKATIVPFDHERKSMGFLSGD